MDSGYNQVTAEINWDEWSRVVEAALDPRHRDAVQKFLGQANLSAEVPAALDEKVLAPRRSEGATGEQCAYVLCNLGFASLVKGTRGAAEFAMACGRLAEQVGPDTADLALRRLFLSSKGELLVAVLTDQPHLVWNRVAARCTAYLRELDQHLETLPAESVETNAMAAYSFAGQVLWRIQGMRAVVHYADEIGQLVEVALALASRLPATFVSRMWNNLIPGTDAGVFFRQIGAMAERSLQTDEDSVDHATKGLMYINEILAHRPDDSAPDLERILGIRAELLLLSGRHAEACEQAESLARSSDPSVRTHAVAIRARCDLNTGNPELAAESLAQVASSIDQALESWCATWMGDTADGYWTDKPGAVPLPDDKQNIWRLQAVAAADLQDMPGFTGAADRCTGFLVDSLVQDRQEWADRMRKATGDRVETPDRPVAPAETVDVDPMVLLEDVFGQLIDGTALLQVINTAEGILTWVAQRSNGVPSVFVATHRPNVKRLIDAHKSWSRVYFESLRHDAGASADEAEGAAAFTGLMEEMRRNWGDLLQDLVEDGVTQVILIGDDLVDIPLHATRIGAENESLIDRVPVTYVPSLSALRACLGWTPVNASQRRDVALRSLIDADLDPADAEAEAVAAILETKPCNIAPSVTDATWTGMTGAQVLHIVARASHRARLPFESLLGEGWLDLSIGQLVAGLNLSQCEIVSNLHCESALPSTLRAPGLDLAALFLAAGARSVLASTWTTNGDLASELAQSFFRRWVTGLAPAAAFREALLQLRSQRPALADFEWAGLRLVGAP